VRGESLGHRFLTTESSIIVPYPKGTRFDHVRNLSRKDDLVAPIAQGLASFEPCAIIQRHGIGGGSRQSKKSKR
jgi:hypothetical protein